MLLFFIRVLIPDYTALILSRSAIIFDCYTAMEIDLKYFIQKQCHKSTVLSRLIFTEVQIHAMFMPPMEGIKFIKKTKEF